MLYSSLRIASATLRWTTSLHHPTRARSHLPGKKSHWAHLVQRFSMCWRQTRDMWFPDIHCCDPCLGRYLRLHTSTHAYIVCGFGSVYKVESASKPFAVWGTYICLTLKKLPAPPG